MSEEGLKRQVAEVALQTIRPLLTPDAVVGVGTGSTANCFIDALAAVRGQFAAAVSSSVATTKRLAERGIRVIDLNDAQTVVVYIDGADEVNPERALIKGGGGALTREKIVAESAERFICIVDASKTVVTLGGFPLPVEVLPMARRLLEDQVRTLGGEPVLREGFDTDNGNVIVDVHGLTIKDPETLETRLNNIAGVVENGLFAVATRPDAVLVGTPSGVETIGRP